MMAQQNELVRQQNKMLQEQAASKKREEKMLQEQAESKLREEQMLKMQQESIDRLIVNQQRVDAILVQNYELHEYPIPRLFVVLPDSFSDWDPRNFLMERFRLHFLCECSDNCKSNPSSDQGASSGQLRITTGTPANPIPVKNTIHLAKHEGYELSRPTEFFNQYGPYVLGMLRILQHCLAVTAVATPVAVLADNSLKDIMDGVRSISERTVGAVNMSINILETKLGDNDVGGDLATAASSGQEDSSMFENLAALEGADLRRLDTFLRNNDRDKILGNLYRITTEQGHVKWVCFEHYKETYRHTALSSFAQSIETSGGIYDPHLGQVTIGLKSSTASKDFLRRLVSQAPVARTLDITLDWNFGPTDLTTLVDLVAKSNVKVVKLDLQDDHNSISTIAIATWRPGKGRYHSLLSLLSNTKLRSLQLSNVFLLGIRTSNLPSNFTGSRLQNFGFDGHLYNDEDRFRLTNIISHCSELVELRLISLNTVPVRTRKDSNFHEPVFSLKKLRRLHLVGEGGGLALTIIKESSVKNLGPMTEIIYTVAFRDTSFLTKLIRQSGSSLEIFVLYPDKEWDIDLTPDNSSPTPTLVVSKKAPTASLPSHHHLCALTHLDLQVSLTYESLQYLSAILPDLHLVHFGCKMSTSTLLQHCNFASLKSMSVMEVTNANVQPVLDAVADGTATSSFSGLEQLFLRFVKYEYDIPTTFLRSVQLTRLYLDRIYPEPLEAILEVVDVSKLQELSIRSSFYEPSSERALAGKVGMFTESLVIELDEFSSTHYTENGGGSRTSAGSPYSLPRSRNLPRNLHQQGYGSDPDKRHSYSVDGREIVVDFLY
ncbi:hypothetical protein BGZ96_012331 [Linnemannia gamsii]|uniref:Uncharacterized protein n=1 Tax=Linnemannia gamsii TaxID=64522 RepID=A0ABQ7JR66_9FUNG|nr:hypothetical protein BGZ96_012331 [Linnemannia gamsii]